MSWWAAAIRSKGAIYAVAALLTAGVVLLRAWDPVPLQILRFKAFDVYQRIAPRDPARLPIVIVDLDDESLAAYGQWPWPRSLLADLVNNLMAMGAGVIAFDIVFAEPDRLSPDKVAGALRGVDDGVRQALGRLPPNDALFAQTIARARVVLGQSATSRPQASKSGEKARKTQVAELGGDPRPHIFAYPGMTRNLPELEAAAAGLGIFTVDPEIDGIVRRVPLVVRYGDDLYPALTVDMLRVATGQNAIAVKSDHAGINSILIQTRPAASRSRPTRRDAPGSTTRLTTAHVTSPPGKCSTARRRLRASAAISCLSAPRRSAFRICGRRRSTTPCRVSRSTPSCSRRSCRTHTSFGRVTRSRSSWSC